MRALKVLIPVAFVLALAACAKPPQADIDAARSAVAAAGKNADIVAYAPESLKSAQASLAQMEKELTAKRYDKVKTLALEAKAMAGTAANDVVNNKAKARADAASLIAALQRALPAASAKVAAARRIAGVKLDFAALNQALAQAKAGVADAQNDLSGGNYASALQKATAVQVLLNGRERTVSDAVAVATNKKK